jgi:hypothetical protein
MFPSKATQQDRVSITPSATVRTCLRFMGSLSRDIALREVTRPTLNPAVDTGPLIDDEFRAARPASEDD